MRVSEKFRQGKWRKPDQIDRFIRRQIHRLRYWNLLYCGIEPVRINNASENYVRWLVSASVKAFFFLGMFTLAQAQEEFVFDGVAGFVVSQMATASSDARGSEAICPNGLTEGYQHRLGAFLGSPAGEQEESDEQYINRLYGIGLRDPNLKNLCQHPELGKPDPRFQTVSGVASGMEGIDLDGVDSRIGGPSAPGTCPHDDFIGLGGVAGVDNQLFRITGCGSPQSSGEGLTVGMLEGAWGVLIRLQGVDSLQDDDDVEVGIYANADPIQLSPNRDPLAFVTYAMHKNPQYRAQTRGRFKDGVLTTDPVDVHLPYTLNSMYLERPLLEARLQMTVSDDGILEGYMAGYVPVEAIYDLRYGFRNGKDAKGNLASVWLRNNSSIGKAGVQHYTCEGAYHALYQYADGHPDPETGKCTAISTQYRIKGIPAFVVDVESKGLNQELLE